MRHRTVGKRLNRNEAHRRALLRNLSTALITHGRIRTTASKAKWLRPQIERMVTMAKAGTIHARRLLARDIQEDAALKKLLDVLGTRFKERAGGYTRILKAIPRPGDNAEMAYIEFLPEEKPKVQPEAEEKPKKGRRRAKKAEEPAEETVAKEE
ncbi:MAG: 50S ribosomal protein L17 [Myxococcales bacterium]|nr:MAG: 50S ribosomal protein L17 [Myxococcales bacterium]